jgi:hypothetical protein
MPKDKATKREEAKQRWRILPFREWMTQAKNRHLRSSERDEKYLAYTERKRAEQPA